jgi:hypothetical protein
MSELYRVMPPQPVQDVAHDTEEPAKEPVEETARAVSEQDERSAQRLAQKVWANGGQSLQQLFPTGMSQRAIDELLTAAMNKQWLAVDGDMVLPGLVNPTPKVTTHIPNHGW